MCFLCRDLVTLGHLGNTSLPPQRNTCLSVIEANQFRIVQRQMGPHGQKMSTVTWQLLLPISMSMGRGESGK